MRFWFDLFDKKMKIIHFHLFNTFNRTSKQIELNLDSFIYNYILLIYYSLLNNKNQAK